MSDEGSLGSDPLNIAVFKNPPKESKLTSQLAACPVQSPPQKKGEIGVGIYRSSLTNDQQHQQGDSSLALHNINISSQQSSLSRAQEWVNKSPIPQQRRFVKSKSLIDASSPTYSTNSLFSSSLSPMSSSVTSEAMGQQKAAKATVVQNQDRFPFPDGADLLGQLSVSTKALNDSKSSISSNSPRSLVNTQEAHSPIPIVSSSSSTSTLRESSPARKSPKLQGLILCVDAEAMNRSSPPTLSSYSKPPGGQRSAVPMVTTRDASALTSTQFPILQQRHHQQQLGLQSSTNVAAPFVSHPHESATLGKSDSSTPPPLRSTVMQRSAVMQRSSLSSAPSSFYPTIASNTTSPLCMGPPPPPPKTSSVSKVSSYSSKTAPSALSGTHYRLPSPTHLRQQSLVPPGAHRNAVSPTPLSPSGDRCSVLSGRSDSLSNRGSLLIVPSDSSDTESIASTGPMLDDEQVNYYFSPIHTITYE